MISRHPLKLPQALSQGKKSGLSDKVKKTVRFEINDHLRTYDRESSSLTHISNSTPPSKSITKRKSTTPIDECTPEKKPKTKPVNVQVILRATISLLEKNEQLREENNYFIQENENLRQSIHHQSLAVQAINDDITYLNENNFTSYLLHETSKPQHVLDKVYVKDEGLEGATPEQRRTAYLINIGVFQKTDQHKYTINPPALFLVAKNAITDQTRLREENKTITKDFDTLSEQYDAVNKTLDQRKKKLSILEEQLFGKYPNTEDTQVVPLF